MTTSRKTLGAVFLLVLIAVFAGVYAGSYYLELGSQGQTIVTPGWEIYDQIVGARQGNQIYTQSSQFTTPNFISAVNWKFDVDDPNSGVPTMQVTVGDIHHVDFSGKDIALTQAASSLPPITRGNQTFLLDDHIYLFTLTIRSIADVQQLDNIGAFHNIPNFNHETSWPDTFWTILSSGVSSPAAPGKPFNGGIYVAFIINPWRGSYYDNTSLNGSNLINAWAGVMNAYVLSSQQGQVDNQYSQGSPNPDGNAPLTISGSISGGNQVPMFLDDGSFSSSAPTTTFNNNLSPDTRIPPSVAVYLPIQIFPGCKTHAGMNGIVDALYPADGYIMYNVRVDVLQTHDFVLQTAVNPPTPTPPVDYGTWAESFWTSFLHGLDPFAFLGPLEPLVWWIVTVMVIVLIIGVLVAIFAPWILPRLAKTGRDTYKAARGK